MTISVMLKEVGECARGRCHHFNSVGERRGNDIIGLSLSQLQVDHHDIDNSKGIMQLERPTRWPTIFVLCILVLAFFYHVALLHDVKRETKSLKEEFLKQRNISLENIDQRDSQPDQLTVMETESNDQWIVTAKEVFQKEAQDLEEPTEIRVEGARSKNKQCLSPLPNPNISQQIESLPKPYLNVGFPKMGTSTLHTFFTCGGLASSHYWCGEKEKPTFPCGKCMVEAALQEKPPLETCGNFDAYAELNYVTTSPCLWPQMDLLEQIHQEHKNATFIIIFRNVSSWIDSVERWMEPDNSTLRYALQHKCNIPSETDEDMERLFCDQVTRVREFVKTHPSHNLVEVQLENDETGPLMSKLFGINASCWGHANKNPKD